MQGRSADPYDVVVVGSGAGGGMTAHILTRAGIRVLMLECGRDFDPARQINMLGRDGDAPLLSAGNEDKPWGYHYATGGGGTEIPGEPYTHAEGSDFSWFRSRELGGRTNHWARNSFRMGPRDFKPASRDGLGVDWPISYEEIEPWYDRVEELVGVYGSNHGFDNHPDSPAHVLHAPPAPRVSDLVVAAAAEKMGMPCVPARRAVLTRPMPDGRNACYWASACSRGCAIGAAFQSTTSLLPWARATGLLDIVTDAMVYEVETGPDGRATGVSYVDKASGEHRSVKARVVALAASSGETARILLNSKSSRRPDGLANQGGQVGRNLTDTVGAKIIAQIPMLENRPRYNEDGAMGIHVYIPFWEYDRMDRGELDFPRGYHYETDGAFPAPGMGAGGMTRFADGYGTRIKEDARRYYGSIVEFNQRGEMIPNEGSYAEIDPEVRDDFGIPVLRFRFEHSQHELNQVRHFREATLGMIDALGGRVLSGSGEPSGMSSTGGSVVHEVGTARMGDDPETSALDPFGRAWDTPNLFVMDGAAFASKAHKNPTLTIMALAWRNSEQMIGQMRRGEL